VQFTHAVAAEEIDEKVPGAHWMHVVEPGVAAIAPAGQSVHTAVPANGAKRPIAHGMHTVARASDHVPAGHGEHVKLPPSTLDVALKNAPAGQCTNARLASGQMEPCGHASHDVAPLLGWNLPTGHAVHSIDPDTAVNEPGPH
jgi:hypothetical protein